MRVENSLGAAGLAATPVYDGSSVVLREPDYEVEAVPEAADYDPLEEILALSPDDLLPFDETDPVLPPIAPVVRRRRASSRAKP